MFFRVKRLTPGGLVDCRVDCGLFFKKGSAKIYRFQKTQVPLPLVKDTGGMAKLSIACSIVFSDGCPRVATNNEKRKKVILLTQISIDLACRSL